MGIESCNHDGYIVVYDVTWGREKGCPVCSLETELKEAITQKDRAEYEHQAAVEEKAARDEAEKAHAEIERIDNGK